MAVPKRKVSKARQWERRANPSIGVPPLVECSHCHGLQRAQLACPTCGYHAGRQAIAIKETAPPAEGAR